MNYYSRPFVGLRRIFSSYDLSYFKSSECNWKRFHINDNMPASGVFKTTNSQKLRFLSQRREYASLPPTRRRPAPKSPISWFTVGLTVAVGSVLILLLKAFIHKKEEELDKDLIQSYGKPELGGDFELVNQDGEKKSNRDFMGQWLLIYFGFTHCPDICPEEMEKMGNVVDIVNRNDMIPNLQPVFISIDPERDSPEAVKKYIAVCCLMFYDLFLLKVYFVVNRYFNLSLYFLAFVLA